MKIESLTSAQKARFPEFIAKWTAIGLDTRPADRGRAERGVVTAYKIAGLAPPAKIVWCGSPLSQGLTRAIVFGLSKGASVGDSVGASVRASVWASVGDSVGASVGASVGDYVLASVWDSVRASVVASVWASVRASVWASVGASVGASVRASVRDSVGDSVRDSVGDSVYGQHDANWLGFFDYFATACALSAETQKLTGLWEVAQSAGWWLPHEKICWISERNNALNRDERGRLHSETGPALTYPDGWWVYAVHGVRVPGHIIEHPETITLEEIGKENNLEIRRVMIERFGWPRYLQESKAKCVASRHNDRDCQREELYRLADGTQRFLVFDPSTGRRYALGVPAEVKDCEQAQNFVSHGLDRFALHRS